MRQPRRLALLLALAATAILVAPVAHAATKAAGSQKVRSFTLKSGLLSVVPEIATALGQVDATPDDPLAWRTLGHLLGDRAAYDDAERALLMATKVAPNNADAWVDLGAVYVRAAAPARAVTAFQKAIKIEPYLALAHYNLGIAHQALRHYDAAISAFETALTIDPTLGDPRVNAGAVVNPDMPYVKTLVYLKTVGAAPSLFTPLSGDKPAAPGAAKPVPASATKPAAAPKPGKPQPRSAPPADDRPEPNF